LTQIENKPNDEKEKIDKGGTFDLFQIKIWVFL
jgi:hypothetical protein